MLSVIVSSDIHLRKQCIEGRNKANKVLGFVFRSGNSRSPEVILKLYLELVSSHLDYVVQFWSPHNRKDIGHQNQYRGEQEKDSGDEGYSLRKEIENVKFAFLRERQAKWYMDYNKVDVSKILRFSNQGRTRSNCFKLAKRRFKKEIGKIGSLIEKWMNGMDSQ